MMGRYGNDALNRFLFGVAAVCILLSAITKIRIFATLCLILLAYCYFRMLSRDIPRRQSEYYKYYRIRSKLFVYLKNIKERFVQRKEYKFFTCPSCKAMLRVPRGRGKIKIVCRKCGNSFIGKS